MSNPRPIVVRTRIPEGAMTPAVAPVPPQQSSIPSSLDAEIICLHLYHFSTRIIAAWIESRTQQKTSHASVTRLIRRKAHEEADRCVGNRLAYALDKLQSDVSDDVECLRILQEDLVHTGYEIEAATDDPKRRARAKLRELSLIRQLRLLQFKFHLAGLGPNAGKAQPPPAFYIAERDPASTQAEPPLSPEAIDALIIEATLVGDQLLEGRKAPVAARPLSQLHADLLVDELPITGESLRAAQAQEPESPLERPCTGGTSPSTSNASGAEADIVLPQGLIVDFARWRLAKVRGEAAELRLTPENKVKVKQVMALWTEVFQPLLSPDRVPPVATEDEPLVENDSTPVPE
jgi:hypothetical protein